MKNNLLVENYAKEVANMCPAKSKRKVREMISMQVMDFLDKYIPDVAAMETQMKKYEKFFKTADGKQKALEKENAELTEALEKSEQQSTLKKLQEARLLNDYERIKGVLDRIPPEIIKAYTHRSTQKHDINR